MSTGTFETPAGLTGLTPLDGSEVMSERCVVAHGNLSCSELTFQLLHGCAGALVGTLERHRVDVVETVVLAAEAGRAAQWWQLLVGSLIVSSVLYHHGRWMAWISLSIALLSMQAFYVGWQMVMIAFDVLLYTWVRNAGFLFWVCESSYRWASGGNIRRRWRLRRRMKRAQTWTEYSDAASQLDELDGRGPWRDSSAGYTAAGLAVATRQLHDARERRQPEELMQLLRAMMVRNHLQIDRPNLHTECRVGTKRGIEEFVGEQVAALRWLAESATGGAADSSACGDKEDGSTAAAAGSTPSLDEALDFFERSSVCLGHTALCLSGGGSLAMHHMGTVKALLENDCMPGIVTGTSGGAIVAAMLATRTDEQMLQEVIQPDIAVRYPERWFPPMEQQLWNYLKNGCLVDHDDFAACCKAYFGDVTFAEAFARTGRVANINISVGSRQGGVGKKALLLNHLTAPRVLVRSALHASCALPTVMHPTTLLMKNASDEIVPFEKESLEFIDGSFTADIPRSRLSELFHVTQDIVAQVNPHVVAMLPSRQPESYAVFHRLQRHILADVLHRLRSLAKLRLLPAMYGPDISAAMQQKYTGDVTIVPRVGGPYAIIKMVTNPSRAMMTRYIAEGQHATFTRLSYIKHLLALEQALDAGLRVLLDARKARDASTHTEARAAAEWPTSAWPTMRRSHSFPVSRSMAEKAERAQLPRPLSPPPRRHCKPTVASPAATTPPGAEPDAAAEPMTRASTRTPSSTSSAAPRHRRSVSLNSLGSCEMAVHGSRDRMARLSPGLLSPTPLPPTAASPLVEPVEDDSPSPTTMGLPAQWEAREGGGSNGGAALGGLSPERPSSADYEGNDARSQLLLSQSVKHTKALQQLSREKTALQKTIEEQLETLRISEEAREQAECRVRELEAALQIMQRTATDVLLTKAPITNTA